MKELNLKNMNIRDAKQLSEFFKSQSGVECLALSYDKNTMMLLDELDEQIDGLDCRIYDKLIHYIEKESFNPYLSIELMNTLNSLGISEINILMNKRRELNNSKQKAISECVAQFKKLEESEPMKDLMSVFTRKTDGRR